MAWIEADGVIQRFDGREVLGGITLRMERGEAFALIGPTGAGKTTLVRLLALLDRPAAGTIRIDGADLPGRERARTRLRRRMAFVRQKPVVFDRRVAENVACALRWRRMSRARIHPRVEAALERVGLLGQADRRARTLSGGEVQRLALARALVTQPEALILDEPTASLDARSAVRIERILASLIAERHTALLFTTHDFAQGHRLAGRIGVLIGGRLRQTGRPAEVFSAPADRDVAEFVGVENILPGIIASRRGELAAIDTGGGMIEALTALPAGTPVDALVRPEDITITLEPGTDSARNVFPGTIGQMMPEGPIVRLIIAGDLPLHGIVTASSARDLDLAPGRRVYARFKATATHIIPR